ncbi:hypothetical protein Tco_1147577 [Tanacetum coccineum]
MSKHRVVDVHYADHIFAYTRSRNAFKEDMYDVYDRFDRMSERKGSSLREHLERRVEDGSFFKGISEEVLVDQKIHWKSKGPCVVFIDELGAFGKQRGTGLGYEGDKREQTPYQLLISGFSGDSRVPNNVLGSSLLRLGGFSRYSSVERIDNAGRSCLENYMVGVHNMEKELFMVSFEAVVDSFQPVMNKVKVLQMFVLPNKLNPQVHLKLMGMLQSSSMKT